MADLRKDLKRGLLALCVAAVVACRPQTKDLPISETGSRATGGELFRPGAVSEVLYQEYSGPLPDRYTERFTITRDRVQFERTGEENGPVNRGIWELETAEGSIEALFETLGAVDCQVIDEISPEAPEIGGGETLYRIEYEGGGTFGLWYRQGYRYSEAELITDPIREFVGALQLPDDAFSLFKTP